MGVTALAEWSFLFKKSRVLEQWALWLNESAMGAIVVEGRPQPKHRVEMMAAQRLYRS